MLNFCQSLVEAVDSADFYESDREYTETTDDHHCALDHVGIDDGGQSAHTRVNSDHQRSSPNAERRVPTKNGGHHLSRSQQHDAHVARHENDPARCHGGANADVVSPFEVFGDREHPSAIEEWDKDERSQNHCWDAANPFEVGDRQPMLIGRATHTHHVRPADVRGDERHPNGPPR